MLYEKEISGVHQTQSHMNMHNVYIYNRISTRAGDFYQTLLLNLFTFYVFFTSFVIEASVHSIFSGTERGQQKAA